MSLSIGLKCFLFFLLNCLNNCSFFAVDYPEELMAELLVSYATENCSYMPDDINIPETHTQGMERVNKAEAIEAYRAPFNRE
jgi:hypothetical protein